MVSCRGGGDNARHMPSRAMLLAAIILTSTTGLLLAGALALCALGAARRRRVRAPAAALALAGAGLAALTLAAGGPVLTRSTRQEVLAMVDLSASTRGAAYRSVAWLNRRIAQLAGGVPVRVVYFAQAIHADVSAGSVLADLPGDRTVFKPPPVVAILLFSDGRFELPAHAPPTYAVVDPMLQSPADGAVRRLELRGDHLAVAVGNGGDAPRVLRVLTGGKPATRPVEPGEFVLAVAAPAAGAASVTAALLGDDRWPENDVLTLRLPAPPTARRWWVGGAAPPGFAGIAPAALSTDGGDYPGVSIIVLDNVPATALSDIQQQRLAQYVRDLGGALVILGGDSAFAAGRYVGRWLDALSPLASSPPNPTVHWILLADSSGSMAAGPPGETRWDMVRAAILRLLPLLPPEDPVTVGSYSENLIWWSRGRSARETSAMRLPPPEVQPAGPTNLEPALLEIISQTDGAMPTELLILSDADADILDPDRLEAGLRQRRIRLHLLDTYGRGRGIAHMRRLARATGGQVMQELDPRNWIAAAQKLLLAAAPDHLARTPVEITFADDLKGLPPCTAALWNRTWLKKTAVLLAQARGAGAQAPMAARWQAGAGQVLAAAFRPGDQHVEAMVRLVERPARDPRFAVSWHAGPMLRVVIDAIDGERYLNGQALTLALWDQSRSAAAAARHSIPQTAPGRYELSIDAPRRPAFAAVYHDGRVVEQFAVAGRYAPEFDAVGNDLEAMRELARRTGGAVIPPAQTAPIRFSFPHVRTPLAPLLAALGAALVIAGLLWWRLR